MPITISGLQNRVKNSYAVAEELGIALIANGEEMPYILTPTGEKTEAGIKGPTVKPTIAITAPGNLTDTKWVIYVYVYTMNDVFRLVAANIRSNPSPKSDILQITGGNKQVTVSGFIASTNPLVNKIDIYRTSLSVDSASAQLKADAGDMYYMGTVANSAVSSFIDNVAANEGFSPVQLFNYISPQFRFTVFDGVYFWGFANHPMRVTTGWDTGGGIYLLTTTNEKFYSGRDNQYISFSGVTTGGIDGKGVFRFKWTGNLTGQTVDNNGVNLPILQSGEGSTVISGETSTLYRSAKLNPFSWGHVKNIGGIYVPQLWQLKVGGGVGTALAVVSNQDLLKLDLEFPTLSLTYNLGAASTDQLEQTKRIVSRIYSVTSHFSQFPAVSNGRNVLWGIDYKNLAVIEFDGVNQVPISGPISTLLRNLSSQRGLHLLSHGVQDSVSEINAIWVTTNNPGQFKIDYCIYHHWPSGFWGIIRDYDVLCSASIENINTSERNTLVGTESGFLGQAFDKTTYGNWLPSSGLYSGTIASATPLTITRSGVIDFAPTLDGVIGNYLIVTSADGLTSQVRPITNATVSTLTVTEPFNPTPSSGWKFYIGLIEVKMLKYFNDGNPIKDKKPVEVWAGLENANSANAPLIQFFPEHSKTPTLSIELKQDKNLDAWFIKKGLPTEYGKTFGLALVDRSYTQLKFFNITRK